MIGIMTVGASTDGRWGVGVSRRGWCRPTGLAGLLAWASVGAQVPRVKSKPASSPAPPASPTPSKVLWRYDSPRAFQLLEPAYRFPTPIKQALIQFVQPVPQLSKAYGDVFTDKPKFCAWFKGVLTDRQKAVAQVAESAPTVLSSDVSKMSPSKGVVTSTGRVPNRAAKEQDEIEKALMVLRVWEAD